MGTVIRQDLHTYRQLKRNLNFGGHPEFSRNDRRNYMLPRPTTYGTVRMRILISVHSDQFAT